MLVCGFYILNGVLRDVSGKGFQQGIENMKAKLGETLKLNWLVWPASSAVMYWYIPIIYRVLFSNFVAFFWNMILSYISYDEEFKKLKNNQ
jgi:hypothetical protein